MDTHASPRTRPGWRSCNHTVREIPAPYLVTAAEQAEVQLLQRVLTGLRRLSDG